jgi:hypothetical protein
MMHATTVSNVRNAELAERVCAVYGCPHEAHLVTPPPATKRAA